MNTVKVSGGETTQSFHRFCFGWKTQCRAITTIIIRHHYVIPYFLESICELQYYIFTNKDSIRDEFLLAFKNLCKKACEMQSYGEKGKIQYINISALRTAIVTGSSEFIMEAYNNEWFFDSSECTVKFRADSLLNHLDKFLSNLKKQYGKYMNVIQSQDMQRIMLEVSQSYFWYAIQISRYSIEQFINSVAFLNMGKESEYYILSGEYKDQCQIIYSNQKTFPTEEKAKDNFEEQEDKSFSSRYFMNLDLSYIELNYFDFRYSSFESSNLSNNKMIGCILSGTNFKNSILNKSNLSASILHDANFQDAELGFVKMEKIFSDVRYAPQFSIPTGCIGTSFKDSNIYDSSFNGSILCGAQFNNARLTNVDFQGCDMQYCDFKDALLENINFKGAILNHTIFNKDQAKLLMLSDEQMSAISFV